jgi:acetylornithine deacetylase/succinyl-diaminopimelate desuccinylase-like protein
MSDSLLDIYLGASFQPTMSVTGVDGMPPLEIAGNVLRTHTSLKLSFRLPPAVDVFKARDAIIQTLQTDPPYNAEVTVTCKHEGYGFLASEFQPWLDTAMTEASSHFFSNDFAYTHGGGAIPFMYELKQRFPHSQMLVTGVLGPKSNAHVPDESIDIPYLKKFISCMAYILGAQAKAATE